MQYTGYRILDAGSCTCKADAAATKLLRSLTKLLRILTKFGMDLTKLLQSSTKLLQSRYEDATKLLRRCYADGQHMGQSRLPAVAM